MCPQTCHVFSGLRHFRPSRRRDIWHSNTFDHAKSEPGFFSTRKLRGATPYAKAGQNPKLCLRRRMSHEWFSTTGNSSNRLPGPNQTGTLCIPGKVPWHAEIENRAFVLANIVVAPAERSRSTRLSVVTRSEGQLVSNLHVRSVRPVLRKPRRRSCISASTIGFFLIGAFGNLNIIVATWRFDSLRNKFGK